MHLSQVSLRFNASEYTTHIFVTALYESDSKQKLLDIKKSHPNSKFIVYGPEVRQENALQLQLTLSFSLVSAKLYYPVVNHDVRFLTSSIISNL